MFPLFVGHSLMPGAGCRMKHHMSANKGQQVRPGSGFSFTYIICPSCCDCAGAMHALVSGAVYD